MKTTKETKQSGQNGCRRGWYFGDVLILISFTLVALIIGYLLGMTADAVETDPKDQKAETAMIIPVESEVKSEPKEVHSSPEQNEPAAQLLALNKIENAKLTHYCICAKCCGKDPDHPAYGITASGRIAEPYVSVAVDPALIPLGSTVYIDYGNGKLVECRADDTGSGVKGAHIDLCVSGHDEALDLGVDTVTVYWG